MMSWKAVRKTAKVTGRNPIIVWIDRLGDGASWFFWSFVLGAICLAYIALFH